MSDATADSLTQAGQPLPDFSAVPAGHSGYQIIAGDPNAYPDAVVAQSAGFFAQEYFYPADSTSSITAFTASGQASYLFTYNVVHKPGGDSTPQVSHVGFADVVNASKTLFFDPDAPTYLVDSDSVKFIRQRMSAYEQNDTGMALLSSEGSTFGSGEGFQNASLWDGQQIVTSTIPAARYCHCLNNQGRFLTDNGPTSATPDGGFWYQGHETKFTDLIQNTAWPHQLTNVYPLLLSNQNAVDGSLYVVTNLQDGGTAENVLWTCAPSPTPPPPVERPR